ANRLSSESDLARDQLSAIALAVTQCASKDQPLAVAWGDFPQAKAAPPATKDKAKATKEAGRGSARDFSIFGLGDPAGACARALTSAAESYSRLAAASSGSSVKRLTIAKSDPKVEWAFGFGTGSSASVVSLIKGPQSV